MAAHPKSWHLIACCRKPRDHQDPERQGSFGISTPSAAPRTKWYHLCRRREAFAVKDGRDAHKNRQSSRAFGNQSGDSLVSSMHCTLISSDESELEDLKLGEELMVDRSTQMVWEDLSDTERQSSRALGNQSGDSSVSSMHCSLFSSSSYQSEVEDCKVDEELIKIIHRHMEDREERANNQDEDVHFLAVLCACCKASYKSCQESLDLCLEDCVRLEGKLKSGLK
ncbi:uncharacterized protein LOC128339766 isoform X4 [Hemicordylus capensis]|uniref:uncharacterized protein LOC128339766 isoform X4 n=1 Tax=Hemicordylus capensis TaxID=884348 RepID=UPI00230240BA|nr:uncharacterized protein LOC128339766 isoform X4 [Hemicordylus capensis]